MSSQYPDSPADGYPAAGYQPPRPDVSQSSVGQLMGKVSADLSTLMRQELELAKAEVKQEATKAGKGAGMLGGAGFAGYLTVLFLSIALWWGLGDAIGRAWSALVVAALWAIVGAVLFVIGKRELQQVNPKPERTAETLKQVPDALRGR